ncbi:type IV secretion system protein [Qipengyuania sp. DGS5-3]|uniref:type IV secretion system protein n=1 Tax=Qipengyuania sp. DGS5-3 TaxID=3349632 RepID=UPI0036D33054
MACPQILTGSEFLPRVLEHIDCQSRSLGTFGYQSLAEPGSLAATVMTGLLTVFIALFALRLLFGPAPGARDTVYDVLKIGIVLTLAFSWPAWKVLVHDVVLEGPAQIAAAISSPALGEAGTGFAERLRATDAALVELTETGTGRNSGALIEGDSLGGSFAGSALRDENAFGSARLVFLASVIGSLALLRLAAGLLLALAPLAAGLLLFGMTRGLFSGWLRGLVLTLVGTLGASLVLAIEMAILGPWLDDVLRVRALGYATPSAPIELFAMTLAFAAVLIGIVWIIGKVSFTRGWQDLREFALPGQNIQPAFSPAVGDSSQMVIGNRAERISGSVETVLRREEQAGASRMDYGRSVGAGSASTQGPGVQSSASAQPRLGSSYRRTSQRSSGSTQQRDSR